MNPHWLTVLMVRVIVLSLSFLASPSGGREIGRNILSQIGLRGGGRGRK